MDNDRKFLRKAIKIALHGIKKGHGPFGAVISKNGEVIAGSNNRVVLLKDPTAHAEIMAIREAAGILGSYDLGGCILYSSCEPCPMCLGAIYWAGIKKIVYASGRHEAARAGFSDSIIYKEMALEPNKRQITFLHIDDPLASEVFSCWVNYDRKILY